VERLARERVLEVECQIVEEDSIKVVVSIRIKEAETSEIEADSSNSPISAIKVFIHRAEVSNSEDGIVLQGKTLIDRLNSYLSCLVSHPETVLVQLLVALRSSMHWQALLLERSADYWSSKLERQSSILQPHLGITEIATITS
jgi:hypothetical protein